MEKNLSYARTSVKLISLPIIVELCQVSARGTEQENLYKNLRVWFSIQGLFFYTVQSVRIFLAEDFCKRKF